MSHIVCITTGLNGILNASIELSKRLEKEGHNCTYLCPKDVGHKVTSEGLAYVQLNEINFDPAPEVPYFSGRLGKLKRWLYKVKHYKQRRNQALESLGMHSFLNKINEIAPDLILVDIELHDYIITLFTERKKFVLLSQWFSTWNRKGLPPLVHDTLPGEGVQGSKLGLKLSWLKVRWKRFRVFFKKKIVSVGTDRRSVLRYYAKKKGFPLPLIKENYWPGPFSYDQLPVFSLVCQALDFPHDIRPNHYYLGHMVPDQRTEPQIPESVFIRISDLIEEARASNKSVIYCSVSTFSKGDTSFLERVMQATEEQPWVLIIGLGGNLVIEDFRYIPSNVHVFERVPQLELLKKADLSINHGGIHTINECVHNEVPMLVYSGKTSDQNGCAARVHYHEIGIMADKDADTSSIIRNKIKTVLYEPKFRRNLMELNKSKNSDLSSQLLKYGN